MLALASLVEQEMQDLPTSLSNVTELVSDASALPCLLCGQLVELEKEVGGEYRVTKMANHLTSCHSLVEEEVVTTVPLEDTIILRLASGPIQLSHVSRKYGRSP